MDYFPQLSTGTSTQYPLKKSLTFRTITLTSEDGRVSKYADGGWRSIQWELQFAGLTSTEWTNLSNHFADAEGRLNSFPFLDGSDNLLLWSGDPSNSAWTVDPLLHLASGGADPNGGTEGAGLQNSGTTWQGISQTLAAPANFTYCFSVFARSSASAQMRLSINGNGQQLQQQMAVGVDWRRYYVSGSLPGTDKLIHFGLQIDQGNQVELFGLQAEPQMGASRYKRTTSLCGVYAACRYDQDQLILTSDRPESYATTIRLIFRESA